MTVCATCTPFGANSFAIEMLMARNAHLGTAKVVICALALIDAVAPVNIRVGGCLGDWLGVPFSACLSRSGKEACEKKKAP